MYGLIIDDLILLTSNSKKKLEELAHLFSKNFVYKDFYLTDNQYLKLLEKLQYNFYTKNIKNFSPKIIELEIPINNLYTIKDLNNSNEFSYITFTNLNDAQEALYSFMEEQAYFDFCNRININFPYPKDRINELAQNSWFDTKLKFKDIEIEDISPIFIKE